MRGIKCQGQGIAQVVDVPKPSLRPEYVLVKTSAVALNPTDWKHIYGIPTKGATVGCDFVGTVEEAGSEVEKLFNRKYSKGERIAGVCHGVNEVQPEDGSFAEYLVAKGNLTLKVPDSFSDRDAATLGVSVTTVGQGLYQKLKLPSPDKPTSSSTPILIYGGSTATGLWAIQYAKLSGFSVLTTCSPRNFELVKEYGADQAFDYKDSGVGVKIREATKDSLLHAFDTISTPESAKICADALSSKGGAAYSNLAPIEFPRKDVSNDYTLAYTAGGEYFKFRGGMEFAAKPEDLEFASGFWLLTEGLLNQGKLRAPPTEVREGGLDAIHQGLEDLKENRVSGKKLVYPL